MNETILNTIRDWIRSWEHRKGDSSNGLSVTQTKVDEYRLLLAIFGFVPQVQHGTQFHARVNTNNRIDVTLVGLLQSIMGISPI